MTAPSDTQLVLSQIMGNQHTNLLGTVHGGNIMKFVDDAAGADEVFSTLMGEDVESRRSFIQRNAKDVRFLDI